MLIHTSYGDLEVELWCKEAPLACRNFIQLAMEGYYDETIFHRLVPRFIVQAGDPTGTGTGGESIYGAPFKVERHSRLSFSRRGILGMASVTSDGQCSSQFFFTLDQGTELDRTNTVFGRVVGDTIYNLVRIGEIEVDRVTERPLFPPKIVSIQILLNPFEDMMPRDLPEVRERLAKLRPKPVAPKPTAVAIKNKTLLSFQDDEEDELDNEEVSTKIMSSHDFLNDPHLSKQKLNLDDNTAKAVVAPKPEAKGPTEYELMKKEQREQLKSIEESIASVQSDLRSMGHAAEPLAKKAKKDSVSALLGRKSKSTSLLEEQRAMYKEKANAIVGKRPKDKVEDVNTLLTLNAFKEKLLSVNHSVGDLVDASAPEPSKVLDICKLHGLVNCLSCRDTFGLKEDGAVGEEGWLMHRLVFDKEEGYKELRQELTNFVVIDPREKEKGIQKGKAKK